MRMAVTNVTILQTTLEKGFRCSTENSNRLHIARKESFKLLVAESPVGIPMKFKQRTL